MTFPTQRIWTTFFSNLFNDDRDQFLLETLPQTSWPRMAFSWHKTLMKTLCRPVSRLAWSGSDPHSSTKPALPAYRLKTRVHGSRFYKYPKITILESFSVDTFCHSTGQTVKNHWYLSWWEGARCPLPQIPTPYWPCGFRLWPFRHCLGRSDLPLKYFSTLTDLLYLVWYKPWFV